jgi:hypothetical protein
MIEATRKYIRDFDRLAETTKTAQELYDLIYIYADLLFWGARNVDGRGFDTEDNRPTNLQIPLRRQ